MDAEYVNLAAGIIALIAAILGLLKKVPQKHRYMLLATFIVFFGIFIYPFINPPPPHFESVVYNTATHHVTGQVVGTKKPSKLGVIVYIRQNDSTQELYPKPDENKEVQPVRPDGSFNVQVYSSSDARIAENDKKAQYYYVLLVPANLNYQDLKNEAIDKRINPWDYAISKAKDVVQGVTNNPQ